MADNVNHPAHYEGQTSLECIDVMEIAFGAEAVANFCLCNAFKYLWRYKNKNGREDLDKAAWYLNRHSKIRDRHDGIPERSTDQCYDMIRIIVNARKEYKCD